MRGLGLLPDRRVESWTSVGFRRSDWSKDCGILKKEVCLVRMD